MHDGAVEFQMPTADQVDGAARALRMLADPTRIKIMWALLQGESSVNCLAELVNSTPSAVSQHLAKLRLTGLVEGRREGTFIYYHAADTHVRQLLEQALFHADHAKGEHPREHDPHHVHELG
ncbi:ArsR family transcriptional regulator [Actinobacteria bacterium YIM 96077]|uniref:Transcriptional regulator n=1 Tax=Phytoactinopolyspora halophila TaxID=1981511 RepID=A0A329QUA6_9ACTN|nr:metalloregulator ArsR/SmtB family transcription factor [Phytoactinopolyspora halophila]AYY13815.1 ArsR family transcriptional regulator [Actinobacteria bacterium YIM 96077]RAW15641.1 transcriptional regulator [Phytoactinopolyspora halophila]